MMVDDLAGMACLRCRASGLRASGPWVECPECGALYPVRGRVPVMFGAVTPGPAGRLADPAAAADLLAAYHLPSDPMRVLQVRMLMASQPRFGDALVDVEAGQFLHRAGMGADPGADPGDGPVAAADGTADEGAAPAAPEIARVEWLTDHIPRVIPPGHAFTANVRFRNAGATVMRHRPPTHVTIAQRWHEEDGRPVAGAADLRTPLPLDLPPGRELTLPVQIEAPRVEGRHRLRLLCVQEGIAFCEAPLEVTVTLRATVWPEVPAGWHADPDARLDYGQDHARAQALLRDWLAARAPAGTGRAARVLEIGGNAYPAIADIDGDLYNVDVDLLGLQIGCLVQDRMEAARPGRRVRQICADAADLPYPDLYFDAVVMFATLHHFPDPARTLAHAARKLRPGGFIGLFCEPVGHVHPGAVDPDFLRELARGVNEQSFLMREWDAIFRAAGLSVEAAQVDFNSLKARLVPRAVQAAG